MPTYEYECTACGNHFEELQSFSDAPLTKCPKCKKNKLTRLFGGGGAIIFKGGGFYETDYRRAGEAKKTENADSTPSESKTETAAETKSESPPPAPPSNNGKDKSSSGGKTKKSPKS